MAAKGNNHSCKNTDVIQGLETPDEAGQLVCDVLIGGKKLVHNRIDQKEGGG